MESTSSGYAVQQSAHSTRVDIDIPEDLAAQFDALPGRPQKSRVFTAEEDAILLAYWPVKNHSSVAKAMGICVNTALRRYRELTGA